MRGDFDQVKYTKYRRRTTHAPKHFCKICFDVFKIPANRSSFEIPAMLYP